MYTIYIIKRHWNFVTFLKTNKKGNTVLGGRHLAPLSHSVLCFTKINSTWKTSKFLGVITGPTVISLHMVRRSSLLPHIVCTGHSPHWPLKPSQGDLKETRQRWQFRRSSHWTMQNFHSGAGFLVTHCWPLWEPAAVFFLKTGDAIEITQSFVWTHFCVLMTATAPKSSFFSLKTNFSFFFCLHHFLLLVVEALQTAVSSAFIFYLCSCKHLHHCWPKTNVPLSFWSLHGFPDKLHNTRLSHYISLCRTWDIQYFRCKILTAYHYASQWIFLR